MSGGSGASNQNVWGQRQQQKQQQQQQLASQGEYSDINDMINRINIYAMVDSWRSYRDDTTSLQQMAGGYQSNQFYEYQDLTQQPRGQNTLNPTASSFLPINSYPGISPMQVQNNARQSLRTSSGKSKKNGGQQTIPSSTITNQAGDGRYNLRSRTVVNAAAALHDVPLPSIEQQTRQSSSVPSASRHGNSAPRRLTPRHTSVSATPPPAPSPTEAYLAQARLPPANIASPQKLLVILDLNGTLLKRTAARKTNFSLRPGVTNFMDYLIANHAVMIYSSARPENVQGMVEKILHPTQCKKLVAVWARDKLGLNAAQYNSKVQVYKKLGKIWSDQAVQKTACEGRKWNQTNTVLIDDSHLKALAQPYNLLRVEEFLDDRPIAFKGKANSKEHMDAVNEWISVQQGIVKDLENKLEGLKWTKDVSRLIRKWQLIDSEITESINDQSIEGEVKEQTQLLTPKSPDPGLSSDESDGGVDSRQEEIDQLVQGIIKQHVDEDSNNGNGIDRSVSPINENVWKEILGGVEQSQDAPQTPRSLDG